MGLAATIPLLSKEDLNNDTLDEETRSIVHSIHSGFEAQPGDSRGVMPSDACSSCDVARSAAADQAYSSTGSEYGYVPGGTAKDTNVETA